MPFGPSDYHRPPAPGRESRGQRHEERGSRENREPRRPQTRSRSPQAVCHPDCHYDRGHHPDCYIARAARNKMYESTGRRGSSRHLALQQEILRAERRQKKEAGEAYPTWRQIDRRSKEKAEERKRKRRVNYQRNRGARRAALAQAEEPPLPSTPPPPNEMDDAEQALAEAAASSPPGSPLPPSDEPTNRPPSPVGAPPPEYHPTPIARSPTVVVGSATITKTFWVEPKRKRMFPIPLQTPSAPLPDYTQEPDERDPDKPTKSAKRRNKQKSKDDAVLQSYFQSKAASSTAAAAAGTSSATGPPPDDYEPEAPEIPEPARRGCKPKVEAAQARIDADTAAQPGKPKKRKKLPAVPLTRNRCTPSTSAPNFDPDCPLAPGFQIFWSRAYACTKEKGSPTALLNSLVQGVPLTDFPRNRINELLSPLVEIDGDKVSAAFNRRPPPALTDKGDYRLGPASRYTTVVRTWNQALGVCADILRQNPIRLALDTESTQNLAEPYRAEMVQIGTPAPEAQAYVFDIRTCPGLLDNPDSPLRSLLTNPGMQIVTHAGHNDARHLLEHHQLNIGGYLDTSRVLSDLVKAAMPELPNTANVSMAFEELCRLMGAPVNMPPPGMKNHFPRFPHISYFGSHYTREKGFQKRLINYAAGDVLNLCEMVHQLLHL
jgi:hypothetical protein